MYFIISSNDMNVCKWEKHRKQRRHGNDLLDVIGLMIKGNYSCIFVLDMILGNPHNFEWVINGLVLFSCLCSSLMCKQNWKCFSDYSMEKMKGIEIEGLETMPLKELNFVFSLFLAIQSWFYVNLISIWGLVSHVWLWYICVWKYV